MMICIYCEAASDDDGEPTCICKPPVISDFAPSLSSDQTKSDSVLEALTNIAIGAIIALMAQFFWFPILGKDFTLAENLLTTAFFTVVSFVRSYGLRRLFNGRSVYKAIKSKLRY